MKIGNRELKSTSVRSVYLYKPSNSKMREYYVRLKYRGTTYGFKNFTKLFGVRNLTSCQDAIAEVKLQISNGLNPFENNTNTLKYLFNKRLKDNDLRQKTIENNEHIFKHLKAIEDKPISKITIQDIEKCILKAKTLKYPKRYIKQTLSPVFNEAKKRRLITENPLDFLKVERYRRKKPLHHQVQEDPKIVAQNIYREILKEKIEYRYPLLITLMCARRITEVLELTGDHIKNRIVYVTEDITKTKIYEEYPLPKEVILPNTKNSKEKLFQVPRQTIYRRFKSIVNDLGYNELTLHNTRRLFITVLVKDGVSDRLVDKCLSHRRNESIDSYQEFTNEQMFDVYYRYWKIVRRVIKQQVIEAK